MKTMVIGAMLLATTAAAQVVTGNPPGNTLVPATGTVITAPAVSAPPAGDMPAKTPMQRKAEAYRTQVVCRTEVQTGSLFAKRKTCLTRKQWDYARDEAERHARGIVHDNAGQLGGPQ